MNDKSKLTVLYKTYVKFLQSVAANYVKDSQIAEDIVQDTFIKLSEHMDNIDDIKSKMTKYYLITITRNKSIDYLRHKKRIRETFIEEQDYFKMSSSCFQPLDYVIEQENMNEITSITNNLSDSYRIPLEMRYFKGMSNGEIAGIMGLSVNLVAVRINRAKKMLREQLKVNA